MFSLKSQFSVALLFSFCACILEQCVRAYDFDGSEASFGVNNFLRKEEMDIFGLSCCKGYATTPSPEVYNPTIKLEGEK